MKNNRTMVFAAFLAMAMLISATSQAKVVSVSPGDGTLQAAINDEGTAEGDILMLAAGTYSGLVDFTKSVTVQPAAGASPVYRFSGHGWGDRLIQASAAGIQVVWNDVPIVVDTDFTWMTLTGNPSLPADNPNTVTFNNVDFSDTSANTGQGYVGYSWGRNTLNFNNCTLDVRAWRLFVTESVDSYLNINDSRVIVTDNGTHFTGMTFITHPLGHITVNRTLVDATGETEAVGSFVAYNDGTDNTLSLTNSVIWFKSGTNQVLRQGGGDVELLHCTFVDRNPTGTAFGTNPMTSTSEDPAIPGTLKVKNCVFDMAFAEGAEDKRLQAFIYTGFVWGEDQKITYDIGLNMLPENIASIDGANDPIDIANQLVANPLLATDKIHLSEGSPAIDATTDVGVSDDFDGGTRPFGEGYDLGADEFGTPATINSVHRYWGLY